MHCARCVPTLTQQQKLQFPPNFMAYNISVWLCADKNWSQSLAWFVRYSPLKS